MTHFIIRTASGAYPEPNRYFDTLEEARAAKRTLVDGGYAAEDIHILETVWCCDDVPDATCKS
jgi:hypothetical protein